MPAFALATGASDGQNLYICSSVAHGHQPLLPVQVCLVTHREQETLPRKPAEGLHRKERTHLSFPWSLPSCFRLAEPPGTWRILRHRTLSFSSHLYPSLLPLPTPTYWGKARALPVLVKHSRLQPGHGLPPSAAGLSRVLTESPWSRKLQESTLSGPPFLLL